MSKFLKCFEVKNATEKAADLYFYGDIVSDWWGAWQDEDQYPDAIKTFLQEQAGKDLNVYINSGGGSVFAGIAIYNMLKRHAQNNTVKVYVDGLAGSIASVIAFAGSGKPVIPANAFLMIHNPWTWAEGNAAELRKMADDLDQMTAGISKMYEEQLNEGVSLDTIKALMDAETWLNGQQAAEYFDVEVGNTVEYAAAVGDYVNRAKNRPQNLKIASEAADAAQKIAAKAAEEETTRNKLKRLVIENLSKGE